MSTSRIEEKVHGSKEEGKEEGRSQDKEEGRSQGKEVRGRDAPGGQ
jgi:hypothetical protein